MNLENLSSYDSILKNFEYLDLNKTSDPKELTSDNLPSNKSWSKKLFKCTICNVKSSSSMDFEKHMNGKRHFENAGLINSIPVQNIDIQTTNLKGNGVSKRSKSIICDLCQVIVFGNIDEHMTGKKHMLKAGLATSIQVDKPYIKRIDLEARVMQSQSNHSNNDIVYKYPTRKSRRLNSLRCTICNVQSSSNIDFEMHMNGKRHFENVQFNNSIEVESSLVTMSNYDSQSVTDDSEVALI